MKRDMTKIGSSMTKFEVEKFNSIGNFSLWKNGWRRWWCNRIFTRPCRV